MFVRLEKFQRQMVRVGWCTNDDDVSPPMHPCWSFKLVLSARASQNDHSVRFPLRTAPLLHHRQRGKKMLLPSVGKDAESAERPLLSSTAGLCCGLWRNFTGNVSYLDLWTSSAVHVLAGSSRLW